MFFTRIKIPEKWSSDRALFSKISIYFPLIGWFVGGASALVFYLSMLVLPVSLSVILSMLTSVLLTGALHEDGLADVCDAFGGGWTKPDILRIMKDSHIGVFGVIGLLFSFILKYTLTIETPIELIPFAIIGAHSLSRFSSVVIMFFYSYVRDDDSSKAKDIAKKITFPELIVSSVFGILPIVLLGNIYYFISIIIVFISSLLFIHYIKKWIGGYTGDVLGANQQLTEIVFYLSIIIIYATA